MMHFPLFQLPLYFWKKFIVRGNFSQYAFFKRNFSCFIPHNFWLSYFSYSILHIFAVSVHFSHISGKLLFPFQLRQISPSFRKIYVLFTYFTCFSFPLFYHDAFKHHTMRYWTTLAVVSWKTQLFWEINYILSILFTKSSADLFPFLVIIRSNFKNPRNTLGFEKKQKKIQGLCGKNHIPRSGQKP